MAEEIEILVFKQGTLFFPIFSHHHWMAGIARRSEEKILVEIYDSAPSAFVHSHVRERFKKAWPFAKLSFPFCVKQERNSEACGIFMATTFFSYFNNLSLSLFTVTMIPLLRSLFSRALSLTPPDFLLALKNILQHQDHQEARSEGNQVRITEGKQISQRVTSTTELTPIPHSVLCTTISNLFRTSQAQSFSFLCEWAEEGDQRKKVWCGHVMRPSHNSDKGPWTTVWIGERKQEAWYRFVCSDGKQGVYQDKSPSLGTTYFSFKVVPQLPPFCVATVKGGTDALIPIPHPTLRTTISTFFKTSDAPSISFVCHWGEDQDQEQQDHVWCGRILRPPRHTNKGPWTTIWVGERRQDAWYLFTCAKGKETIYEDKSPSPNIAYFSFEVVPQLPLFINSLSNVPKPIGPSSDALAAQENNHKDDDDDDDDEEDYDDEDDVSDDNQAHDDAAEDKGHASPHAETNPLVEDPTMLLFRSGHHIPSLCVVTQMTVSDMLKMLTRPVTTPPAWAQDALASSTRQTHQRLLKLMETIPSEQHQHPLIRALGDFFERRRQERKWTWSTMLKNLVSLQGALALLPLYRATVFFGLSLKGDIMWRQLVEASARKAKTEIPRTPQAMTPQLFNATLSAERDHAKAGALTLAWFTAQRIGCVLKLNREDVVINSDTSLSVTFRRGKTATVGGPYCVHTTQLQHYLKRLQPLLNISPKGSLFHMKSCAMLSTFRAVNNAMEAKSIRRGSLQQMARSGTPIDILMRYSGHTREKTLLRYLNWGSITQDLSTKMALAGVALMSEDTTSQVGQH